MARWRQLPFFRTVVIFVVLPLTYFIFYVLRVRKYLVRKDNVLSPPVWHSVGSSTFTDIDYADDAVLFTADPAEWDWEEVLLSYETAASTMGLHCNWQKTKVQNVGAGPAPPPVQMENQDQVHLPWLRCRIRQFIHP